MFFYNIKKKNQDFRFCSKFQQGLSSVFSNLRKDDKKKIIFFWKLQEKLTAIFCGVGNSFCTKDWRVSCLKCDNNIKKKILLITDYSSFLGKAYFLGLFILAAKNLGF